MNPSPRIACDGRGRVEYWITLTRTAASKALPQRRIWLYLGAASLVCFDNGNKSVSTNYIINDNDPLPSAFPIRIH